MLSVVVTKWSCRTDRISLLLWKARLWLCKTGMQKLSFLTPSVVDVFAVLVQRGGAKPIEFYSLHGRRVSCCIKRRCRTDRFSLPPWKRCLLFYKAGMENGSDFSLRWKACLLLYTAVIQSRSDFHSLHGRRVCYLQSGDGEPV